MREAPEETSELRSFLQASRAQWRTMIADLGPMALAAERSWEQTLAGLRSDWSAALDADSAAWIEAAFRLGAYPHLAPVVPKVAALIRLAAASVESDEQSDALIEVAAGYEAEAGALIAANVSAIELIPLSEADFATDRWFAQARWLTVEEHRLQQRELMSRAVRDAVIILGEENLPRSPWLRRENERSPFEHAY